VVFGFAWLRTRQTARGGAQAVQARCRAAAPGGKVEVLTLDLTAPYAELQAAAALADGAFGGAGIDYLVHNAGRRPPRAGRPAAALGAFFVPEAAGGLMTDVGGDAQRLPDR